MNNILYLKEIFLSKHRTTVHLKQFYIIIHLLALVFAAPLCAKANTITKNRPEILVPLNKTTPLSFSASQNVVVTNSKLLKIRNYMGKLLATGLKEGTTTIFISKDKWNVHVLSEEKIESYLLLQHLLKDKIGLTAGLEDNEVVLKGKLLRFSDWLEITKNHSKQGLKFILKTSMSEEIRKKIEETVYSKILESQLPIPSLITTPYALVILSESSKKYQEQYKHILESLGYKIQLDKGALSLEPIIDLKVQIVELKKSNFESFGISLPGSYQAQIVPASKFKLDFKTIDIALNAMESSGHAKILATPHLSCRTGKEAHFLAGGEFPIKIVNFHTNDIQWKKHGILLNFKPLADRSGKISLYLKTEISLLDKSQAVDGIPGLLVNRVESHIDLFSEQTIALSGLIKRQSGSSQNGLPLLQHLPILGSLFSSADYQEDRTDLVIFVTPRVLTDGDFKHEFTN